MSVYFREQFSAISAANMILLASDFVAYKARGRSNDTYSSTGDEGGDDDDDEDDIARLSVITVVCGWLPLMKAKDYLRLHL